MKTMRILLFYSIVCFLTIPFPVFTQEIEPLIQEEAPTSLFEASIGDSEVDLFISGSWGATLGSGFAATFHPQNGIIYPSVYPSLLSEFLFSQAPDLTFSLWYDQRYFAEASIVDNYDLNSYVLGYQGRETEFLRNLRIGNQEIGIESIPGIALAGANTDSPGVMSRFQSTSNIHELLLRYEPSDTVEQVYIGKNRVEEGRIEITDYVEGRFFLLPDSQVQNLRIWIEAASGNISDSSGNSYRLLNRGTDFLFDNDTGLLYMKNSTPGKICIFYTKNNLPIGSAGLGENALCGTTEGALSLSAQRIDFTWALTDYLGEDMIERQVELQGNTALVLYAPGEFSPFQASGFYASNATLPESRSDFAAYIARNGDTNAAPGFENYLADPFQQTYIRISAPTSLQGRSPRYPLLAQYPELYGPDQQRNPAVYGHEIFFTASEEVDEYTLDETPLPDSITVSVNNIQEPRFEYDDASNTVRFLRNIYPNDRIVIEYNTSGTGLGDIVFASSNRFTISPSLSLYLGTGLKWQVQPESYEGIAETSPGRLLFTAGGEYSTDNFTIRTDLQGSYYTPNTSGALDLFLMEGAGFSFQYSTNNIYPASVFPEELAPGITLSAQTRGKLFYRRFWSRDIFGSPVLNSYTPEGGELSGYESGNKPGPYLARYPGGTAAVMEFSLENENQWVGMQLPLGSSSEDFSNISGLRWQWKGEELSENIRAFVIFGAVSEDLDDDNTLDAESSELSSGFIFNDTGNGTELILGTNPWNNPNNEIDSEDTNSNNLLDPAVPELTIVREVQLPESSWLDMEILLTDEEQQRLVRTTGFQIILVNTDTTATEGSLLISSIQFTGSTLAAENREARLREIPETWSTYRPEDDQYLETAFPDIAESSTPSNSQSVLEVSWDDAGDDNAVTLRGSTPSIPRDSYEVLSFYLRSATSLQDTPYAVTMDTEEGTSDTAEFTIPGDNYWHKVEINWLEQRVYIDNAAVEAAVTVSDRGESYTRFSLTAAQQTAGTFYVDHVRFTEPIGTFGGAASLNLSYSHTPPLFTILSMPVLSNSSVSSRTQGITTGYSEFHSTNPHSANSITQDISVNSHIFPGTQVSTDISTVVSTGQPVITAGHTVDIGPYFNFLALTDRFSLTGSPIHPRASRRLSMTLGGSGFLSNRSAAELSYIDTMLIQTWMNIVDFQLFNNFTFSPEAQISIYTREALDNGSNYFLTYGSTTASLIPHNGISAFERTGEAIAPVSFSLGSFQTSLRLKDNFRFVDSQTPFLEDSLELTWESTLSVPIFSREITCTAEYLRSAQYVSPHARETGILSDIQAVFQRHTRGNIVFTSIPFSEIYTGVNHIAEAVEQSSTSGLIYTPSFQFSLERQYGSYLIDLFVPSRISTVITRESDYKDILITDTISHGITLDSTGINLFGNTGVYSLFSWYEIDSFTNSFNLTVSNERTADELTYTWSLRNYGEFLIHQESIISLENSLAWEENAEPQVSEELTCSMRLTSHPEEGINIPFYENQVENSAFFTHTISITGGLTAAPPFTRLLSSEVLGAYGAAIVLPQTGRIGFNIKSGLLSRSIEEYTAPALTFGLEAGIEVKIEY